MCMFSERLQILIDPARRRRLEVEASQRGTSVAALIREAIDARFPHTSEDRRAAAQRLLDAKPMTVPDVAQLRAELDEVRGRRA